MTLRVNSIVIVKRREHLCRVLCLFIASASLNPSSPLAQPFPIQLTEETAFLDEAATVKPQTLHNQVLEIHLATSKAAPPP